jgi:hypothetical protein
MFASLHVPYPAPGPVSQRNITQPHSCLPAKYLEKFPPMRAFMRAILLLVYRDKGLCLGVGAFVFLPDCCHTSPEVRILDNAQALKYTSDHILLLFLYFFQVFLPLKSPLRQGTGIA